MTAVLRHKTEKQYATDPLTHPAKVVDKRARQTQINKEANRLLKEAGFSPRTGLELEPAEPPQDEYDDMMDTTPEALREIFDSSSVRPETLLGLLVPQQARRIMRSLGDNFDDDRHDRAELGMAGSNYR